MSETASSAFEMNLKDLLMDHFGTIGNLTVSAMESIGGGQFATIGDPASLSATFDPSASGITVFNENISPIQLPIPAGKTVSQVWVRGNFRNSTTAVLIAYTGINEEFPNGGNFIVNNIEVKLVD